MAFDPRSAEKKIAPQILEEIDGRNVVSYRYKDKVSLVLIDESFIVDSLNGPIFEKTLSMSLSNVVNHTVNFGFLISATDSREITFTVNANGKSIESLKLNVSGQPTAINFSTKLESGLNRLQCVAFGNDNTTLNINIKVAIDLNYNKKKLVASDLGSEVFYVERILLNPNDLLMFDSFENLFNNTSSVREKYVFSKPIAIRELTFVRGRPEVVLYYFRRKD